MLKILLISFLSFFILSSDSSAYQKHIYLNRDSVNQIYQTLAQTNPNKDNVDQLNNLATEIYPTDYLTALSITKTSLAFAQKIKYKEGETVAFLTVANCFNISGQYKVALDQINKADKIAQTFNDFNLFAKIYSAKGVILVSLKNYDEALYTFNQALNYLSQINPNHKFKGEVLQNISDLYFQKSDFKNAIDFCNDAIIANNQTFDNFHLAENYLARAKCYQALANYANAKDDAFKAIAYAEDTQNQNALVNSLNFLASIAINFGEYPKANSLLKKSLEISKNNLLHTQQLKVYESMSLLAKSSTDFSNNSSFEDDYRLLNDSLNNPSRINQLKQFSDYYSSKNKEVVQSSTKKEELSKADKTDYKNLLLFFSVFALLLSGVLAFLFVKRNKEIKQAKLFIAEQDQQIKEQKEALEALNHLKNRFFSIVSHDLRGPILSLKGMLDLHHNDLMTPEETKYFMNELNQNFGNTATLVDNLLTWSKSQIKGEKLIKRKIDLSEIVNQVILIAQPKIAEKQIIIHQQIEQKHAYADEEAVAVVIRNLVSNALKFVEVGGTIHISSHKQDKYALISIKDDGVGMTKEQVDKISNHTFYTTTGTQKEKGNGLGLFLCTEFVKKNGGDFWIESEKDKGSFFYFTLPIHKV
jgi:two-component system sensor histidine kinase/response regulator